nr:transporter [Gammaproteobacteria bacterium]
MSAATRTSQKIGVRAPMALSMALLMVLGTALVACAPAPRQQPAREAIKDGVVTAKVKEALTQDPLTRMHEIDVNTFRGTVQLRGFVETREARERALELARAVRGVKKVEDALQVRGGD